MKIWAAMVFVFFMGVSVYVILNERHMRTTHPKVIEIKPAREMRPYELQKKRIDSEHTTYKFESKNKKDNYKLNEDQLDDQSEKLLKSK